ncbi:MAG: TlpA disulfide reductase family protein [Planctomycetota bacterium]
MATISKSLLTILLLLLPVSGVEAQETPAKPYPIVTKIPAIKADGLDIPEQTLELTAKNGWLVATLTALPDELEWTIVLAKLQPDVKPVVTVHPGLPLFSVQYGPWFIREGLGRLRVLREPKKFDEDQWAVIEKAPDGKTICSAGRLFVIEKDNWCWLCTSPKYDNKTVDTAIRFQHLQLKNGSGSMLFADGQFGEVFCGDARCQDEGDLLVAERNTGYGARATLAAQEIKDSLVGKPLPQISGKAMGPIKTAIGPENLKGKVVLIDFWATWCGPCVKKLPEVNKLQEKYSAQGLVVIGIHSSNNAEGVEKFLDTHPVQFPIVVDDGETERRFAVSAFPTYYLVGRDGKVSIGFENSPPTAEQIEAELKKTVAP